MPLYAVETVRMLVTEGRLEAAGDGTYRATGTLGAIDVPASLHALIAARLDALPAPRPRPPPGRIGAGPDVSCQAP